MTIQEIKPKNVEPTAKKQRIVGKPFPKGQSGNPNGRPKDSFSLITILKRQLQEIPPEYKDKERKIYADLLIKKQLHKAIIEGDVAMIRLIWNYIEGMPPQPLTGIGGKDLFPVPILNGLSKNGLHRNNGNTKTAGNEKENS